MTHPEVSNPFAPGRTWTRAASQPGDQSRDVRGHESEERRLRDADRAPSAHGGRRRFVSTALIDRGYSYKEEATLREEVRMDRSSEEIGEVRSRERAEITANGGLVIDQPGIYLEIPKANLDAFINSIAKIIADQVIAELAVRQHSKT
jgi:hypothetical protein